MLKYEEVLSQSKNAFAQWDDIWQKNSKINGEIYKQRGISHQDMLFQGAGRTVLCIAYGPSFEDNIEIIKEYRKKKQFDIICVDKAYHKLVENGIYPEYCVVCDAGISYEKYLKSVEEHTKHTILFSNVNANTEWVKHWQGGICFYVNKDNIETEKIYSEISGCYEFIPASSNVSNSVLIIASGILKFDKYLLVGYDYCWGDDDNYYAFENSEKRYWMKHVNMIDIAGRFVHTSQNLLFSCRWMTDYLTKVIKLNICNCSGKGIMNGIVNTNLEKQLEKINIRNLSIDERNLILRSKVKKIRINDKKQIDEIYNNYNVVSLDVNYLPKEATKWAI